MPIKVTPFINPFRTKVTEKGDMVVVETHNGKQYQRIVRKK